MAPNMRRKLTGGKQKPRRAGFVYKRRSADQVKARAEQSGGRWDSIFKQGFDTYRAQNGSNTIRFLPPTWGEHDHYGYEVFVHGYIGPNNDTYLCPQKMLQKRCPICEAAAEARQAGEEDEERALSPTKRVVTWIIDRDGDNTEKPLLYNMPWTTDRDIAAQCVDNKRGSVLLIDEPNEGYDVTFRREGQGIGTKYFGFQIDRESSPVCDDEDTQQEILGYIQEHPIPDCLKFYNAEYLERVLSGTGKEKDEELDDEDTANADEDNEDAEESDDRGSRRGSRERVSTRRSRDEDESEDGQDDDADASEEDDGEDERSSRRERVSTRRGRTKGDDDDEGDDNTPFDEDDSGDGEDDDQEASEEEDEPEERPSRRERVSARRGRNGRSRDEEEEESEERPSSRRDRERPRIRTNVAARQAARRERMGARGGRGARR